MVCVAFGLYILPCVGYNVRTALSIEANWEAAYLRLKAESSLGNVVKNENDNDNV
jgi:hypothetical protein